MVDIWRAYWYSQVSTNAWEEDAIDVDASSDSGTIDIKRECPDGAATLRERIVQTQYFLNLNHRQPRHVQPRYQQALPSRGGIQASDCAEPFHVKKEISDESDDLRDRVESVRR